MSLLKCSIYASALNLHRRLLKWNAPVGVFIPVRWCFCVALFLVGDEVFTAGVGFFSVYYKQC